MSEPRTAEELVATLESEGNDVSKYADNRARYWALDILKDVGLSHWNLVWTPGGNEGITLWKVKEIRIHWEEGNPDYSLLLHEIAHAMAGPDHGHDSEWAAHYTKLVRDYMYPLRAVQILRQDVREWVQLAKRQRDELPRNGPVTPTDAGIACSESRLREALGDE